MTSKYTPEEQAQNRAKWTAALRSGDYQQGRGELRSTEGETEQFCCLGVACEIAAKEGVTEREGGGYAAGLDGQEYVTGSCLPPAVADWLGITQWGDLVEEIAAEGHENPYSGVVGLNDGAEWTFEQIAELVDAGKLLLAADDKPADRGVEW